MNWLIKNIFYLKFLWLKKGIIHSLTGLLYLNRYRQTTFYSDSFTDGQWNEKLPWWSLDKWNRLDWNTYGHFKQLYGRFYFKVRLDGLVAEKSWPAIWLLDIGENTYCEIDIELFRNHFGFTLWINNNGKQETAKVWRSQFANRRLRRELQKNYHLYCIDWTRKSVKIYIDGILAGKFRHSPKYEMQIILSKLSMSQTIVEK